MRATLSNNHEAFTPSEKFAGDAALIAAYRNGENEALTRLFQIHYDAAKSLAYRLCRDSEQAQDIANEAFARVVSAIKGGNGPTVSFGLYLNTAVRSVVASLSRVREDAPGEETLSAQIDALTAHQHGHTSAQYVSYSSSSISDANPTHTQQAHDDDSGEVIGAFNGLPENLQQIIWLKDVDGLSVQEVAQALGKAAPSVSTIYYRARAKLRELYLEEIAKNVTATDCSALLPQLSRYVTGSGGARSRKAVEAHLEHCEHCQHLHSRLENVAARFLAAVVIGAGALLGTRILTAPSEAQAASAFGTALTVIGTWSVLQRVAVAGTAMIVAGGTVAAVVVATTPPSPSCSVRVEETRDADTHVARSWFHITTPDAPPETELSSVQRVCTVHISWEGVTLLDIPVDAGGLSVDAPRTGEYTVRIVSADGTETSHYRIGE